MLLFRMAHFSFMRNSFYAPQTKTHNKNGELDSSPLHQKHHLLFNLIYF